MLLVMLGAVILLMRQVRQPAAVEFLGRVFGEDGVRSNKQAPVDAESPVRIASATLSADGGGEASSDKAPPLDEKLWEPVKDNAIFLPAEQPAWLALLRQARDSSVSELANHSLGKVAYAQLIDQPDAYRGQSVRVTGRAVRESIKPVPKNDFGVTELHQLVVAPRGGGEWPIVVYAIELPAGFPHGENLKEDVVVDGLFFKNWSFPYEGGMGLAPVLVTPTLDWTGADSRDATLVGNVKPAAVGGLSSFQVATGGILAGAAAAALVVWAAMQTRRPRRLLSSPPDLSGLESDA
jgi:hypothetical protein